MELQLVELDSKDSYKTLGELTKEHLSQGYEILQITKRWTLSGMKKVNILTKDNIVLEIIGKE